MISFSKFRVSLFSRHVYKGFRTVRAKLPQLIEQWQKICILAERIIKRREAAAVRGPQLLRRVYLPTHLPTTSFSPSTSDASSILSGFSFASSIPPLSDSILSSDDQADLSRLTTGFRVLNEVNRPMCWRGDGCELANGLKHSIDTVAQHLQTQADLVDHRVRSFLFHLLKRQLTNSFQTRELQHGTLEALKVVRVPESISSALTLPQAQRDLYIAMRDLFFRQTRLSIDQVERLKKRVESTQTKLNSVRDAKKDGWDSEAEKLVQIIETDQAAIGAQLNRRVYIRAW